MSKTVDQRVVEMRFDNSNFEKNVQTSMTTLEKFKKSLNFSGASKGLENINEAAKNNNMHVLGNAVESVGVKFSALQVAGVTAMTRLTNHVIDSGTRMIKALTIDPVKTGFNEYELKMGSIQTIMASTGESLSTVNQYLNELNEYSDKTIYSFSDMTTNIGKFTNAGVKLEDAVLAIKGVSNEAAVSGANANEASHAMYNFAQALSAGYVKLIDWKSIENANMATVEFKEQLIQSALSVGTLTKTTDGMYKTLDGTVISATRNFNESLQDQWMTTDVLIKTLKNYADETTAIGKKAYASAQDVKTFSMMCDTLKEAAQSGWAQTWEIIFGDFNEGKKLWTSIANTVGGLIDKMSQARNTMLSKVFNSPWEDVEKEISKAGIAVDDFKKSLLETAKKHGLVTDAMIKEEDAFNKCLKKGKITKEVVIETLENYIKGSEGVSKSTEDMTEKLKTFQKIVDQVWNGDFKNGQERADALTKAGYNYAEVQALVNKTVNGHRLTLEDLSDAQLKNIGYTNDEIKKLRELAEQAKKTGTPLNELLEKMSRPTGRFLLLESFSNFMEEFSKLTDGVKQAWQDVFGDVNVSESLYGLIEQLHELSESFQITDEQARAFKTIIQGAFAGVELSWTIFSMSMVSGLKILNAVLDLFGMDLLKLGEYIANLIIKFNDWAQSNTLIWGYIQGGAKVIKALVEGVYECIKAFLNLDIIKGTVKRIGEVIEKVFGFVHFEDATNRIEAIVNAINNFFSNVQEWIKKLDSSEIGRNIVDGLVNGLEDGLTFLANGVKKVCKFLIDTFCSILGIESPSVVFMALGAFLILGLTQGITGSLGFLWTALKDLTDGMLDTILKGIQNGLPYLVDSIGEIFKNLFEVLRSSDIDFGAIFVGGTIIAALLLIKKLTGILEAAVKPVGKFGSLLGNLADSVKAFTKAGVLRLRAESIKAIAISIAILAGSLIALSMVPWQKLLIGSAALAGLVAMLIILTKATSGLEPMEVGKLGGLLLSLSTSLLIMSFAISKLSSIDSDKAWTAIYQLTGIILAFSTLFMVYGTFVKGETAENIQRGGKLLVKMAIAIGIMAIVMKLVSRMDAKDIVKGTTVVAAFELMIAGIIAISKYSGEYADKAAKLLTRVALCMGIMTLVLKSIAGMSYEDIIKGMAVLVGFKMIIASFIKMTETVIGSKNDKYAYNGLIKISLTMGIMALIIKLLAGIPTGDVVKGMAVIALSSLLFKSFIKMSKDFDANGAGTGSVLLKMSIAIGILVVAIRLLAGVSAIDIAKGLLTVLGFEKIFAVIIKATKYAGQYADKAAVVLTKMATAILILVGAIAILSLLKPEKVIIGTAAISALILCFSVIIRATEYAKNMIKRQKTIIMVASVIAAFAGIIALLSLLDPKSVMSNSAALALLMISFGATLAILGNTTRVLPTVRKSMGIMLGIATGLAGLILLLSLAEPDRALASATALSIVLTSFAGSLAILGAAGRISTTVSKQMRPLLLVVTGLAAILTIMSTLKVEGALQNATALSVLLLSFSVAVGILGTIGDIAGVGIDAGLVALAKLTAGVGIIVGLLGALNELTNGGAAKVIDDGVDLFAKIGEAIGAFVGSIIGGFAEGVMDVLPTIGGYLSDFMSEASDFIDGLKAIKEADLATTAETLASAIMTLTQAGIKDFIWTGNSSLAAFGEELKPLGAGLKSFAEETNGLKAESVTEAIEMIKSLSEAATFVPKSGGLAQVFGGEQNIETFGTQLVAFGTSLKDYSDAVSGIENMDAVNASANAAKALVSLAEDLPNTSGLIGWLVGEQDLGTFGVQLTLFGSSLVEYSNSVADLQIEPINNSAKAGAALVQLANDIPQTGGLLSFITGHNDMATFGVNLVCFGSALASYAEAVTGLDTEAINTSATVGATLIELSKSVPQTGGLISFLVGQEGNLGVFGEQLAFFGLGLASYAESVTGLDTEAISSSIPGAQALMELAKTVKDTGETTGFFDLFTGKENNLENFGSHLAAFGGALCDYSNSVTEIDAGKITSSINNATNLRDFAKSLENFNSDGIDEFKDAMKTLSKVSVDKVVEAFDGITTELTNIGASMAGAISDGIKNKQEALTSAISGLITAMLNKFQEKKEAFTTAGKVLMSALSKGISNKEQSVRKAISNIAEAAIDAVEDFEDDFKIAGKNLGNGLVGGIEAKYRAAYNAGYELGQWAVQGEKDGQQSHSPSKLTIKAGKWLGEGLIVGMKIMGKKVGKAGQSLGKDATASLSSTISRMTDFINTDIETQPTIRPILDLNSVKSGVNKLNGMFTNPNVGAISSIMSRRGQNGVNDDVVSAIDKLGKKLGNIGSNSYSINGLTVNGDSEVENAIKVLIRATKIEGRT